MGKNLGLLCTLQTFSQQIHFGGVYNHGKCFVSAVNLEPQVCPSEPKKYPASTDAQDIQCRNK